MRGKLEVTCSALRYAIARPLLSEAVGLGVKGRWTMMELTLAWNLSNECGLSVRAIMC